MRVSAEAFNALIRGERRGPVAALTRAGLRIASWPYSLGVWWKNRAYDRGRRTSHRVPVPVVCIGNLTLGGTGKTPCVEYVANFYRELGVQVAILSRGYGSSQGRNDEAMVLEENLPDVPHLQDPDRVAAANRAIDELESELLVLDDGFQHRRLHRDLDIVLIDATSPPSRDYAFPRGTLREPVSSLRRAGAIVITRCNQVPETERAALQAWLKQRFPDVPVATSEHRPVERIRSGDPPTVEPPETLHGAEVAAFCGIGNPTAFRHTLEELGARIAKLQTFPDHHDYTRADVDNLHRWAGELPPGTEIVTTQKDWVKLRLAELGGRPLSAIRIGLVVRDGQDALEAKLRALVPAGSENN